MVFSGKSLDWRAPGTTVSAGERYTDGVLVPLAHTVTATIVTVYVPGPLRNYCAGASELGLSATSVRGVLGEMARRHPALHRNICDETGAVRRHINLFVNTLHIRDREGLDTPLAPGDVVTVLPAVSGG
jgi:molybdopterin converting factor small subunit